MIYVQEIAMSRAHDFPTTLHKESPLWEKPARLIANRRKKLESRGQMRYIDWPTDKALKF